MKWYEVALSLEYTFVMAVESRTNVVDAAMTQVRSVRAVSLECGGSRLAPSAGA